ncbi:MAG: hypothetical protein KA004_10880 [Verrucomicrobiales bacterium]|nr:hypothetical protein [Verrucomicrobiales bacterium]
MMPVPLRILTYLACAGLCFALGRYLFPAASSLLAPADAGTSRTAAVRDFWTKTTEQALAGDSAFGQCGPLLELLDRLKPEDFSPVASACSHSALASRVLAARWAEVDPPGFFKHLASHGTEGPQGHALAGILVNVWAASDLNAAQAAAARLQSPDAPFDIEHAIALALLRKDTKQGLAFVTEQKLDLPPAVMEWELEVNREDSQRWKSASAGEGIDCLQALPPSIWRDAALDALFATWVAENPKALLLAAQETGRGAGQIQAAVAAWMQREPDALVPFFQQEAKEAVKAAIGVALARRGAEKDAQNAWDFAQWSLAGRPRVEAYRNIIETVAETDPLFAWKAWVADAADEPWRRHSLQVIAKALFSKQNPEADAWFEALSATDQRDAALALIADPHFPDSQRTALKSKFNVE